MKRQRERPEKNFVPVRRDMHQTVVGFVQRAQAQKYRRNRHDLLAITRDFWIVSAAGNDSHQGWRP